MSHRAKIRPAFFILIIAFICVMTCPVSCRFTFAADSSDSAGSDNKEDTVTVKTTITGVNDVFNIKKNAAASDTIMITNPGARSIKLQMKTNDGWHTYKNIKLKNTSKQKIKIKYPAQWRKQTYSTWRIYLPKKTISERTYESKSESVKFIVINKKKLSIRSASAVIMDENGYVLYSKNPHQKRLQASVTKLMTALLTLENYKPDKTVRISGNASRSLWQSHPFRKGMRFKKDALMHAALLPSYNSAAVALAESKSGSQKKFVKLMNKKAKALGMKDTYYKNPHGLYAKGHRSSAYDSSLLLKECYKYKTFRRITAKNSYVLRSSGGSRIKTIRSTYSALRSRIGKSLRGGKTGYEDRGHSGRSFAGVYKVKGKVYYVTTLGAQGYYSTATARCWNDQKKLYKYIKEQMK